MKLAKGLRDYLDRYHLWAQVRQVIDNDVLVLSPLGEGFANTLVVQRWELKTPYLSGRFLTLSKDEGFTDFPASAGSIVLVRLSTLDKMTPIGWASAEESLGLDGWTRGGIDQMLQPFR